MQPAFMLPQEPTVNHPNRHAHDVDTQPSWQLVGPALIWAALFAAMAAASFFSADLAPPSALLKAPSAAPAVSAPEAEFAGMPVAA
jgi:hypothetical protein